MSGAVLPGIKIVRHARATRLRLRVDAQGARLTAPVYCSQKKIQQFLEHSNAWLIETWQLQQQKLLARDQTRPTVLQLFNLQQPLQVEYHTQKPAYIFKPDQQCVLINTVQAEAHLKAFVIAYAKSHLPTYLQQISAETGIAFAQCNIRHPKTRWGSCSQQYDIMLNAALVLFPVEITRYVCVHELAHTRYFDHSSRFWSEVARFDVAYLQHRKILKTTEMPYWWY
ncbi:hypothetical protein EC844_10545 [Acinetobacter calcoaceticus]|uniref:YgjP-like metallopeptidase domain-containing protein n=1 Tax=Acinetobacter calcoaceticus TaxID=471 RepID=A0A4R1XYG7_ACICA|nr:hypothetical protein EC844_10545 [Acinetobacter calcoaceticus]